MSGRTVGDRALEQIAQRLWILLGGCEVFYPEPFFPSEVLGRKLLKVSQFMDSGTGENRFILGMQMISLHMLSPQYSQLSFVFLGHHCDTCCPSFPYATRSLLPDLHALFSHSQSPTACWY